MGRGRKKAVKSSEPDALALPIHGVTDSTLANGDSVPPNSNNNGNQPIIASPFQSSSVQNSFIQIPLLTDGGGDDNAIVDAPAPPPTKLDEGFFEIETIRRKRVRKGQVQYLVKWHGWPETANTWEPSNNLQACSEFIEEFEKRMEISRSGKQRKRKLMNGDGENHSQEHNQHQFLATDNVTEVNISMVDDRLLVAPLDGEIHHDLPTGTVAAENEKVNEYDLKLIELKVALSGNMVDFDKTVEASKDLGVVCDGSAQGSHSIGAKRRKSNRVKRFTKDAVLSENSEPLKQNGVTVSFEPTDRNEQLGAKNPCLRNVSTITRIIRPVGYSVSVSNNIADVVVTFLALSSDGKEVTVNNKFLKVDNPLLLINFYEQHLRYNPTF